MSLFTKLFEAVHSWRRRRGGIKPRKRSDLAMEQLDHRQLLTVNFTGNVPIDFPATQVPGVSIVTLTKIPPTVPGQYPYNQIPMIPGNLQGVIPGNVVGLEIDAMRVSYDPTLDVLSVGVEGPNNAQTNQEVIAGDSDNNLNSGTVNPIISSNNGAQGSTGIDPSFTDPPDMGGTKTYGVSLNFNNTNIPQIVAGFPQANPAGVPLSQAKVFEVAGANLNTQNPAGAPTFNNSAVFPQYAGNYYLNNTPNHPNFEFQIAHFSQLYQQISGTPLTPASSIGVGAFATGDQNIGISDEFFPITTIPAISQAIPPTPTPPPPPPPPTPPPPPPPPVIINECSPTISVNLHQNNHVNTAHPEAVRVNVLGSSGFDPTTLIPSTVKFGDPNTLLTNGASPILSFENNVNHDQFPDETFVFNGLDVKLPSGATTVQLTGETTSGMFINSQVRVFNRDYSYYTTAQAEQQQARWLAYDKKNGIDTSNGAVPPPPVIPKLAQQRAASAAIDDLYTPLANKVAPKQVNPNLGTAVAASSVSDPAPAPAVVTIRTKGKGKKGQSVTVTSMNLAGPTVATATTTDSTPTATGLTGGA